MFKNAAGARAEDEGSGDGKPQQRLVLYSLDHGLRSN